VKRRKAERGDIGTGIEGTETMRMGIEVSGGGTVMKTNENQDDTALEGRGRCQFQLRGQDHGLPTFRGEIVMIVGGVEGIRLMEMIEE